MGDPAEENDPPPESRVFLPKCPQAVNKNFTKILHAQIKLSFTALGLTLTTRTVAHRREGDEPACRVAFCRFGDSWIGRVAGVCEPLGLRR